MKGARSAQSRPYWVRYVVAFWAVEKLTWAKDNVVIACVCSLAPGLIAAGISAALSDDKWLAATYATLLTYGGLFALFLTWRLVATRTATKAPIRLSMRMAIVPATSLHAAATKLFQVASRDELPGQPAARPGMGLPCLGTFSATFEQCRI